jgi:hypothetical protein
MPAKFKKVFYLLIFFIGSNVYAQFINPESVRSRKDTSGFAGTIGLDINYTKNTSSIFALGNSIYIQYKYKNHLIFFINNINIKKINSESIINRGTQHLRYNYKFNNRITGEVFIQSHYNKISKIDKRQLVGAGPRFTLFKEDKFELYLGTLVMYEYEKIKEEEIIYNHDFRFSGYASVRWFPAKNTSITSTTFYQPKLNDIGDYRIYSHNSVLIKVVKGLSIGITYIATYDTHPANEIPKYQFKLLNGLIYTFD